MVKQDLLTTGFKNWTKWNQELAIPVGAHSYKTVLPKPAEQIFEIQEFLKGLNHGTLPDFMKFLREEGGGVK